MQTELHHVRTLKIMGSVLRRAMLEELQLQPGAVNAVFPCVDELSALHQRFLAQLLQRRRLSLVGGSSKNFVIQRLGDVLVSQVWGGVLVWGGPGQSGMGGGPGMGGVLVWGGVLVSQVWGGGVLVWGGSWSAGYEGGSWYGGGPGQLGMGGGPGMEESWSGGWGPGTRGHDDEPNGVTGWHWETSWPPGEGTGVTVALRAALVSQGSTVR